MDWKTYWESEGGPLYYENLSYRDGYRLESLKIALGILKDLDFNTVLDIGIGYGWLTKPLMDQHRNAKVVGIDIASSQIDTTFNYMERYDIDLRVIDFMDMEKGESWDLVYCWSVLLHIPPDMIEKFVSKMFRDANRYVLIIDAKYDFGSINNRTGILDQWSHNIREMYPTSFVEKFYGEVKVDERVLQPIILWERIEDV